MDFLKIFKCLVIPARFGLGLKMHVKTNDVGTWKNEVITRPVFGCGAKGEVIEGDCGPDGSAPELLMLCGGISGDYRTKQGD